jgi:hypothetical protein
LVGPSSTALLSSTAETPTDIAGAVETSNVADTISTHLQRAARAVSKSDVTKQEYEVEAAERALVQWVDDYRGQSAADDNIGTPDANTNAQPKPDVAVFEDVIGGLLSLPPPYVTSTTNAEPIDTSDDINSQSNSPEITQQIRSLLGKSKNNANILITNNKSERATQVLDLMEAFHEPMGSIYDDIIASHGGDVLDCLSHLTMEQLVVGEIDEDVSVDDDDTTSTQDSPFYQQAWKSAKTALQLLNRSEDLYRETGKSSSRLPSISSYVTTMDVWKALAIGAEEKGDEKKRDEALETVKSLRQRRLDVYSLEDGEGGEQGNNSARSKYSVIPSGTNTVEDVLAFATNLLSKSDSTYKIREIDSSKIGTWHFNQLIFDLANYPQPFSGPLAQDLLEFMMYAVQKASPTPRRHTKKPNGDSKQRNYHIVPKPNTDTINGVLKAWMVTPNISDAARRAESILAQLAVWQSNGSLWGVQPNVVSYNTCINCWKESGINGAAARATEILTLLEDSSTDVYPDVVSYSSCMGAWAECSYREVGAGRKAEEILTRMYTRSKEDDSLPKPNTRCFNAVLLAYANGSWTGGGKRALELLRFMERLHSEGYDDVRPDAYTLNIVMKALTNCGESGAAQKANQILRRMEESFSKGDTRLQPDLLSYNIGKSVFVPRSSVYCSTLTPLSLPVFLQCLMHLRRKVTLNRPRVFLIRCIYELNESHSREALQSQIHTVTRHC